MLVNSKSERVPVPPDGGYGWVILLASFFIIFALAGCMYSIGLILPHIRQDFGVTQEQVNLLSSLNNGFLFCSGPIVAGLSNQLGIRPVVMFGAFVTSLCYVVSAYSPSIYLIMVAYGIIGGISSGALFIPCLIIVAQYFDRFQGLATGITMAGSGVGNAVFSKMTQILVIKYGWKVTLIIFGSIFMQCCFFGALLRPVPTKLKEKDLKHDQTKEVQTFTGSVISLGDVKKGPGFMKLIFNILKDMTDLSLLKNNIGFLLIALSNFFVFCGYFIPSIYIPIRAKEISIADPSLILGLIGLVNIPARLAYGFLADTKFVAPIILNTLSVLIGTLGLLLYIFLNDYVLQLCFSVVYGIGTAGINSLTTPYLKDLVGMEKFPTGMGIVNLFRGFGCFLGPYLAGVVSEKFNGSVSAFLYSGIVFSIGLLLACKVCFGIKLGLFTSSKCKAQKKNESTVESS